MKVEVPFLAQATATRLVKVEIPDDTPPDQIRKRAEDAAINIMRENEDVMNSQGDWEVNMVEGKTIYVDNTQKLSFPAEAVAEDDNKAFDRPDDDTPIVGTVIPR